MIARGRVVDEANFGKVLINVSQVFQVRTILEGARLKRWGGVSSMPAHTQADELTSRKNRPAINPLPWSSQSMTGSAYSCTEAVKMTTWYHVAT